LLAHEMAHAVVAQRNGISVEAITLWLFGGVAKLEGEPDTPGADFRVAAVGPAVSVVLAVVFTLLGVALDAAGSPDLVVGVALWLGLINAVLAVFNLVPAAPLDGGRILRAALWWHTGDRTRAAVSAARAGRGFGWFLIAVGVGIAVLGGGIGGLWLAFIGWFITMAARGEEDYARMSGTLAGVTVGDVMTPDPVTVPAGTTVDRFIDDFVFSHNFSTFPVVDVAGKPVGLVALREVKAMAPAQRAVTTVEDLAVPLKEVTVVTSGQLAVEVLARMNATASGRALVMAGDTIVGLVSPVDVMRRLEVAELRAGNDHPDRTIRR
jgi:Zn-dependent protease/CBS domain-containing protein